MCKCCENYTLHGPFCSGLAAKLADQMKYIPPTSQISTKCLGGGVYLKRACICDEAYFDWMFFR